MPTKMTPENGLHYRDALTHFISDETREEWKRAGEAAGWNKSRSVEITTDGAGVSKNQRYDAVRRFMSAENAVLREFRELVKGEYIVGFGYPDTLDIEPRRMPSEEWSFLSWKSRDGTTFEGGGRKWFRVMFHAIDDVETWKIQIEQMQSGMLLEDALEAYSDLETYREAEALSRFNYVISFVEDPDTEDDRKKYRHRKLRGRLEEEFIALLISGELDVWAFADGEAIDAPIKQIPPSKCGLLKLNFQRGGTKRSEEKEALATLAGTNLHNVRFFPAGVIPKDAVVESLELSHDPIAIGPRRTNAFQEVSRAWAELPQDQRDLVSSHGGKIEVARILHKTLPRYELSTIRRNLRKVLE